MKKRLNKSLVLSVIAVVLSITFAVSAIYIYAWLAIEKQVIFDGASVRVTQIENNGYILAAYNDDRVPNDGFIIYPRDKMQLNVQTISANEDFGLRIKVKPLSEADFRSFFLLRDDLVSGRYQKSTPLITPSGSQLFYYDFDIDLQLAENPQMIEHKVDFLYRFTVNNSIYSAITVTLISVNDVTVNLEMKRTVAHFDDVYYLDTPLPLSQGDDLVVEVAYGKNMFLPTIAYAAGESSVFDAASYQALNYNCFIGQQLTIGFENKR